MTQAIFLSYASEDADAARRICNALRAAGLEVWFDQNELRGGDAWDASIRKQIKECTLFVPIISNNTQAREEGYFRLEWKLAVDRSHFMAEDKAFFFPVLLDDVAQSAARVPDKFRERQWTKLNDDAATNLFVERIAKILIGKEAANRNALHGSPNREFSNSTSKTIGSLQNVAQVSSNSRAQSKSDPGPAAIDAGLGRGSNSNGIANGDQQTPSIAVLAFANRSASVDDEYFSDGLADELLNVLTKINGLRVAARTSAFSFKGKSTTLAEIGQQLNVATLLEGSVRRSGNRVRVSVQLVKADDGFQLWFESYDRTLDDIFAVQDDIAQSVVNALRAKLMQRAPSATETRRTESDVAAAVKGRSQNSEAHRLYLQARFLLNRRTSNDMTKSIEYLRQAVLIDPNSALLWATLSTALTDAVDYGRSVAKEADGRDALVAAQRALLLEPDMADGHTAMCHYQTMLAHDWRGALKSAERALIISPDDGGALREVAKLYSALGRIQEALALTSRAVERDPLNAICFLWFARTLTLLDRWAEAEPALRRALELSPDGAGIKGALARCLLRMGRVEEALAEAGHEPWDWMRLQTTAEIHFHTGNLIEGDQALKALIDGFSDDGAFNIACVYAMKGDIEQCFDWLERAYQQRDSGLTHMNVVDPLRTLHTDPRWPVLLKKIGLAE